MNVKRKLIVREISAARLAKLDAAARAREAAALAAEPAAPMPVFISGRAPGVRVLWPKHR
jgi:hypothetical protein